MQKTKFWVILGHFLPFDPLNNPKFWKNKITPGDIIILHLCTTNVDHTVSGSWDIKHDRIFCYFGSFLFPLTLVTIQKSKILKKWKKSWRYYHFTDEYHESKSYDVWFLRLRAQQKDIITMTIIWYMVSETCMPLLSRISPAGAKFQAIFNLATCSNYAIINYLKIIVFNFLKKWIRGNQKWYMSTIENGQILLYCHFYKITKGPGTSFQCPAFTQKDARNVCHTTH